MNEQFKSVSIIINGRVRVFAISLFELFGELHALTQHRAFVRVRARMNNVTVANGGFVFTSHHIDITQSNTQHVEYVQTNE